MSIIATALEHMLAAGMDRASIVAAVRAMEAVSQPTPSSKGAQRQARYEARKRQKTSENVRTDASDETLPPPSFPPRPPKPPTPIRVDSNTRERTDFEVWYEGYPNKVGRPHAERAFGAASKLATFAELIEGRDRYIRTKPPDRAWCNPATWLNQQRWKDQPAEISTLQAPNGRPGFSPTAKFDARQANLQRAFEGSERARLSRMGG